MMTDEEEGRGGVKQNIIKTDCKNFVSAHLPPKNIQHEYKRCYKFDNHSLRFFIITVVIRRIMMMITIKSGGGEKKK